MKQETGRILEGLLSRMPELAYCEGGVHSAFSLLAECYANGGKLLICGNGGSAADAGHIAGELMKGFLLKRPLPAADAEKLKELFGADGSRLASALQRALPAISLPDQTTVLTAFANDVAADMAFAQMAYGLGKPGDALLAVSTSGNAANAVYAAMAARAAGLRAIGLTGRDGGKLRDCCDIVIKVPATETYRVQEYHLCVYHALCAMLEFEFFGE